MSYIGHIGGSSELYWAYRRKAGFRFRKMSCMVQYGGKFFIRGLNFTQGKIR